MTAADDARRFRVDLHGCPRRCLISDTPSTSAAEASRPNILLIQADDLGYGDLSAYGQARFSTPSLDRLAREGIRFTEYYAGTTVCAPSRTTLMTGMHTGHAWIRGNGDIPLRPEDVTIAEMLRDAGYRTAVIGKWGLGSPGSTGMPDRQGFDHAFGFLDHRHAHRQYTDHLWRNGERAATDLERDYVNDLFTREAAAFIQRDDARPFFVYLNYTVPHAELRAPEDSMAAHRGRFPEKPFENQKADAQAHRCQPRASHARVSFAAGAACGLRRDDYAHGSRHRTLADLLRARGIERNTLIMFVSDNGPHQEGGGDPVFFKSSGPLRGIKRDLYEGGIRVPMIASWPGHHSRRPCKQSSVGALGYAADARRHRGRRFLQPSTASRWRARFGANRNRRTSSSIGSFTSAASSRPCGWDRGRRFA